MSILEEEMSVRETKGNFRYMIFHCRMKLLYLYGNIYITGRMRREKSLSLTKSRENGCGPERFSHQGGEVQQTAHASSEGILEGV